MPRKKLPAGHFEWTPERAYAVGLIVTDGNLSGDGRHIILRSKDIEQIKNFKKCLGLKNKIGTTKKYFQMGVRRYIIESNLEMFNCIVGLNRLG